MAAGWSYGQEVARMRQREDEELQSHANRISDELASNRDALSWLDPQSQEYKGKVADLQRNLRDLRELFHPAKIPTQSADSAT
jgi:hypothetical protein